MKSLAIIGNGTNTKKYGKFIDTFDEVVRINGGSLWKSINDNYEYVGTKTSLIVLNNWNINVKTNILPSLDVIDAHKYAIENNIPILYSRRDIINTPLNMTTNGIPIEIMKVIFHNTIGAITKNVYDEIEKLYNYKFPTSGLKTLFYFLEKGYNNISLFNFGYSGKHFFDEKWYDIMLDSNKESSYHNGRIEREIIEDLQKQNKIKIYE